MFHRGLCHAIDLKMVRMQINWTNALHCFQCLRARNFKANPNIALICRVDILTKFLVNISVGGMRVWLITYQAKQLIWSKAHQAQAAVF